MTAQAPDPALRLVLGSASPRRLDLLAQAGIVPHAVRPPEIDESPRKAELPAEYVRRIARDKIAAIPAAEGEVVLCADTTVALGRRILGKPGDEDDARRMLSLLSGRRHRVITAVAVRRGARVWERAVTTTVAVKSLSPGEIAAYLATGDWRGKAGSYAIQGPFGALIPWINGSFTGVVGLPLTETLGLLTAAGLVGGLR
ncbi:Maf family protein [Rubellimicrobium aerolatum]|uniref:dTTP/UTP pyrophosphatase n=1 Tax=Rubellimicrobium aerolatum TaxID=490979 RepID=A0ABW0SH45_9RHOB|nr:Maf family protein [Rubellimicrobium aerolatum]MBP1807687.1 septum formation protein [Rubellimicrobium aerolatum]